MASTRKILFAPFSLLRSGFRRLWKMLFQPASRYPADPRAVFILALSVFTGLAALVLEAGPATLEALLPRWGVTAWGASVVVGSTVTLLGMSRQTAGGIIIEQVGSMMVAAATLFYSTLAFYLLGSVALQTVGIIAAWGMACLLRYIQLQALIVTSVRIVEKREILRAIEES